MSPFDDVDAGIDVEADDGASAPAPVAAPPARPSGRPSAPRAADAINADIEAMRKEHDATGRWGDAEHAKMKGLLDEQLAVQDTEQAPSPATADEVTAFLEALDLPAGRTWKPQVVTRAVEHAERYHAGEELGGVLAAFRAAAHEGKAYTAAEGRHALAMFGEPEVLDHYAEAALTIGEGLGLTEAIADLEQSGMDRHPGVRRALARLGEKLLSDETLLSWYLNLDMEDAR